MPGPADSPLMLLADDDPNLRRLVEKFLKSEGYSVISAADGKEAVELSRAHRGRINLLLTDIEMPQIDGVSAYQQIMGERPDMKVLSMSGGVSERIKLPEMLPVLRKPFILSALGNKVREVLETKSGPRPKAD